MTIKGRPDAETNRRRIIAAAHRWFFGRNVDFEDWCDAAGFDAGYVRRKAKKVYEEGLPPPITQALNLTPEQRRVRRNALEQRRRKKQRKERNG